MTQGNLDRLRKSCSFPSGIQARIPKDGETILSTRLDEVAFYEAAFHASLQLPIHPTIRKILNFYNICPAQLSLNAWRSVVCVLVVCHYYKGALSLNEFRCLFSLFKTLKPNSGWLYFKARLGKTVVKGSPTMSRGGKGGYSSSWGTIRNFLQAYLERKEFRGSRDHGAPQVSLHFALCYFIIQV